MFIDFLFEVFRQNAESEAVIWHNQSFAYRKLLDRTNEWRSYLRENRDCGWNSDSHPGGFLAKCDRPHVGSD